MRTSLFLFLFLLSSFILVPEVSSNTFDEQTSIKIIKEAELKYKRVLKVKNAWRDTKKIIKNAKKAHKAKDYKKSVTLGKKALNEANMAYEQYEKQKDNYRFLD
tara:strand:- start:8909 stop:9220 length:312 start_codon:yes stop_codon:yes gene_type:complete